MKVLFISNGNLPDYMCDSVFHGMRTLLGDDCVDVNRIDHMYADYGDTHNQSELYGRGMTLFCLLPSDKNVDRTDIVKKLQNKFFDVVVFGAIQRCQFFFGGVTSVYPRNQVVTIDGEDSPTTLAIQDSVLAFKRELCSAVDRFFPIHFGIPEEKILKQRPTKNRLMAEYDPLINGQSYIYETEADYYRGYADSYFAPTMRKMGFDCMRHYEILANWAIPYFRGVDGIPDTVMHRYPKKECDLFRRLIEYGPEGCKTAVDLYERLIDPIMAITRESLTTSAVAKYVLDTVAANK
jgi:hypothetical protein